MSMFHWSTLRESDAEPVDIVDVDNWLTCGVGDSTAVASPCGGGDGDGAALQVCADSNNSHHMHDNDEEQQQQQQQRQHHRSHRQYPTTRTASSSNGNNELANALAAHAESRRRERMMMDMVSSTNDKQQQQQRASSSYRSLDMAARIHNSFTNRRIIPSFLQRNNNNNVNSSDNDNGDVDRSQSNINLDVPTKPTSTVQTNFPLNKKNSILSMHTDSSSSSTSSEVAAAATPSLNSSGGGGLFKKYRDNKKWSGRWSASIVCLGLCVLLFLLLGSIGIGVGVSIRNSNNNGSSSQSAQVGNNNNNNEGDDGDDGNNVSPSAPPILDSIVAPSEGDGSDEDNNAPSTAENDVIVSNPPPTPDVSIPTPSPTRPTPPNSPPSQQPTSPPSPKPTDAPRPPTLSPWIPIDPESELTAVPGTLEEENEGDGNANVGYDYLSNSNYLVGVYYYPWHGDGNFHNNDGYIRSQLVPPHQPELGEYNDSDPKVIAAHMKYFRQANIGLLVTSWWGPRRMEDTTTKDVILEHEDIGNLQVALHYETSGRIKGTDMTTVREDMQYICTNYFDHPNYYKIDDRPVLVIYISRSLHSNGILEEALLTMRSEVSKCGHNIYLIGDQVFASAPSADEPFIPFWYFDAVTNYDVYGSANRPSPFALRERVDAFYSEQEKWRQLALQENCRFIPPVSPGYNDRAVRLERDHPPLSRRLDENSSEGSLFWYQLKKALPLVDPQVNNMILVNSFNEWHEDTQIEPAIGEPATEPMVLTGGLTYLGYGDLYLDILRAATTDGQEEFFDYLLG